MGSVNDQGMLIGSESDANSSSHQSRPAINSSDGTLKTPDDRPSDSATFNDACKFTQSDIQTRDAGYTDGLAFEVKPSVGPYDQMHLGFAYMDEIEYPAVSYVSAGNQDTFNLPSEQALNSEFSKLCFSTVVNPQVANYKSPSHHVPLSGDQYAKELKNSSLGVNSLGMLIPPSPDAPNGMHRVEPHLSGPCPSLSSSNIYETCKLEMNFSKSGKPHNKQDGMNYFAGNLGEQRQNVPLYCGELPSNHGGLHNFQVPPTDFSVSGPEFPGSAFQLPYYLGAQLPPCMKQCYISQNPLLCAHSEGMSFSRKNQKFNDLQKSQYQGMQSHNVHDVGYTSVGSFFRNGRHQYYAKSMLHPIDQPNCLPGSNNCGICDGCNNLSIMGDGRCCFQSCLKETDWSSLQQNMKCGIGGRNLYGNHILDRHSIPNIPQNVLTSTHSSNMISSMKPVLSAGLVPSNNPFSTGKISSEGFFHPLSSDHASSNQSLECTGRNSCGLSSERLNTLLTGTELKEKYNSLDEIVGSIYEVAKDQNGCRFLQDKISGTVEEFQTIFIEIIDHIIELMIDPFGNYLVQKLVEVCTKSQVTEILLALTKEEGEIFRVSCDMYGTRAIQKVIGAIKTPEQASMIVSSLKPDIVMLMKHTNGHHVAQCCLLNLSPEYNKILFSAAASFCVDLAAHKHGCRVLPKYIDIADEDTKKCMLYNITSKALCLAQDQYGNYVVQHVILRGGEVANDIVDQLLGRFAQLAMLKSGSHVVEACLKHAGNNRRIQILHDLINSSLFGQILQDQCGNYVVQTALSVSERSAIHGVLLEAIRPHVPALRSNRFGKKVLLSCNFRK